MKKKSSIIKLSIIGVVLILGIILSFVSINFGNTTFKSFAGSIKLGLDLKGGVYAVYEMDETENTDNISSRMEGTRIRLENLLRDKNYTEATVVKEGTTRLRVEVPDVDDPGKIFDIIGQPAELKFVLEGKTVITGEHVLSATGGYDQESGGYAVYLSLNNEGTDLFAKATASENQGKAIDIITVVDGTEKTISSPTVNNTIVNGKAIITGMQSQEMAQQLADQITSGQFEVKLSLQQSSTISPTLGGQALNLSLIAGLVGLILVMAFMIWRYRMFGVIASGSLLLYAVIMIFLLSIIPGVQLSLPGIAGILLSIGMAVDANVIIYERIKEEYRGGKSILASYYAGFKKAFWSIFDSNITTIIAGVVLLIFGSGTIQSFAVTLLIGIVLSMLTAILVTRGLIKYVLSINSTDEKIYGLKRGKGFESLGASDTDAAILAEIEKEKEEAEKKKNAAKKEGEIANETI